ncbi:hypothetical protein [Sodalis sp. RH16]|uniref:hypothetical protein n=1 Tax=Sodalis sp. RH16 TaxID=3394331 RepID=UPI0039B54186
MPKTALRLTIDNKMPAWVTIPEAVEIATESAKKKITPSDIYRHALSGNIILSIYFQSPVILKKIQIRNGKLKFRQLEGELIDKLCLLDNRGFTYGKNLILSTEDKYIHPMQQIIDTTLMGYEYVLLQRMLAHELHFPLPIIGAKAANYGITVNFLGEAYQIFEKMTWLKRAKKQIARLPQDISHNLIAQISENTIRKYEQKGYFPLHNLPPDARFVIRQEEVEKLINLYIKNKEFPNSSTRMTTPLSRLFWLACKHNDAISPQLKHPYKLLSIFEIWASDDGITESLSAETLKNALERGAPPSAFLSR